MKKAALLIFFFITIGFAACETNQPFSTDSILHTSHTDMKTISQIYISIQAEGFVSDEYKIDLTNGKFLQFHTGPDDLQIRNPNAENEGFQKVSDLVPQKIKAFQKAVEACGITDWNDYYSKGYDGDQGLLTFIFADGTKKEIFWRNAYPETWVDMCFAIQELTGAVIIDPAWMYHE